METEALESHHHALGGDESDGEIDADSDGVPDSRDSCVGWAEDYDGFQDYDGCPDMLVVALPYEGNEPHPGAFDGEVLPNYRNTVWDHSDDPVKMMLGTAGAVALVDSPAPGPADLVALGIVVVESAHIAISVTAEAYRSGNLRLLAQTQQMTNPLYGGIVSVLMSLLAREETDPCVPCEVTNGPLPPSYVDTGHCHWPYGDPHEHYFEYNQNPQTCACSRNRRARGIEPNITAMCCGRSWGVPCGPNGFPAGYQAGGSGASGGDGNNNDPWNNNHHGNSGGNPGNSGGGYIPESPRTWIFHCEQSNCEGYPCTGPYDGYVGGTEHDCRTAISIYCGGASGQCTAVR